MSGSSFPVTPSNLVKRVVLAKPWLLVVMQALLSYPGLSVEELHSAVGLSMEVVKRAVWWLKKFGIVEEKTFEEKSTKLFVKKDFSKPLQELLYHYCKAGNKHLVLVDDIYIVVEVKGPKKLLYWSIPRKLYEELVYYERLAGAKLKPGDIAQIMDVQPGVAQRLFKLRGIVEECKAPRSSEH